MHKLDFLRDCMRDVPGLPIDQFNTAFCVMCGNRQCSRSGANNLAFDRRVSNWKNDLFDNVPRASDRDPGFDHIRLKRFIPIEPESTVVPDVYSREPDVVINVQSTEAQTEAKENLSVPLAFRRIPSTPASQTPQAANTPFIQGAMLPGNDQSVVKISPQETEIESGGSFTFGGDDE